jgi:hypothetical protein
VLALRSNQSLQLRGPVGVPERNLERIARRKCGFQLAVKFQIEALLFQRFVVARSTDALSAYVLLTGVLLHVALQINRGVHASCQVCA